MSETRSYQNIDEEAPRVSGTRFSVQCVGHTNGAHLAFVSKIKDIGHHEVFDDGVSDYDLMFCPVTSRVGTDIGEAMTRLRAGKQTILVVMHHTYDPGHMVIKSSRHVDNKDVVLTVDCFFYNGELLQCKLNDEAWAEIQRCLGAPPSIREFFKNLCGKKKVVALLASVVIIIVIVAVIVNMKKARED